MTNILDKHPAPWRELDDDEETDDPLNLASGYLPGAGDVLDAHGGMVIFGNGEECEDPSSFADAAARRLILAAPELLAALRKYVDRDARNRAITASDDPRCGGRVQPQALESEAAALIARIERGG